MKHISVYARTRPGATALVMDSGQTYSYGELDRATRRLAAHFNNRCGLTPGQVIAVLLENRVEFLIAALAALRIGLYVVPINRHLKQEEVEYIVADSQAQLVVSSVANQDVLLRLGTAISIVETDPVWLDIAEDNQGGAGLDITEQEGQILYYSSGTTGRPKGILRPVADRPFGTPAPVEKFLAEFYNIQENCIYLCPAPLYHAAPLNWAMTVLRNGGTVVIMSRFDALSALRLIDQHRVTAAQFVPTMFVRLLQLGADDQKQFDLSSLRLAVHAGAPCPPDIKSRMIEWWGMIIHEYYGGSETNGLTAISPQEWLAHPGSVGRPVLGELHICDEQGNPLPVGETGAVYFSGMPPFSYKGDPQKTQEAFNAQGWSTLGDIGYVDAQGYLYLKDRKAFMIISGGVNIYPLEVENTLMQVPHVIDVAVLGLPHRELGEEVVAVIELKDGVVADDHTASELVAFCKSRIASFKCPKRIIFMQDMPRLPNGKLLKRELLARIS